MPKILVVDDEKNLVNILKFNLHKAGYEVIYAEDGERGLQMALTENPDLVFLDIMLPKLDGYEVCKRIRKESQVPITMLSARVEEVDKVLGFELGADDYITKPFGIQELLARVKASLRKYSRQAVEVENILVFGDLTINLEKGSVYRDKDELNLSPREFELVAFLAKGKGQVFTREGLLETVWGYVYFGDLRLVDVTIRRLRMKLESNPENPQYILTKRGVGYYFTSKYN